MRRIPAIAVAVAIALMSVFVGCTPEGQTVSLPETPVLSGRDRYALVVETYVRVHALPARDSEIRLHLRYGDVLPVVSRTADGAWLEIQQLSIQGWIEGAPVRLFPTREQALNAREESDG